MDRACILVVEDNPDLRLMLHLLLETEGYEVVEAEDGLKAIEALAALQPDMIITDLVLPQLDGLSLIRTVRGCKQTSRLPIIAISAYGGDHLAKASANGADETVCKPMGVSHLLGVVARLLPHDTHTWH